MSEHSEKLLPWAYAGIGAIAAFLLETSINLGEPQRLAIIQSVISVASILIGFLGTALAIILSFFDREIFRKLANKEADKKLVGYILHPIYGLFATVALCMALLAWTDGWFATSLSVLLGFSIVFSCAALIRIKKPIQNILDEVQN